MSTATAVGGWVAAGVAVGLLLIVRHMLGGRMEAVARACHELRGPLAAARLGLSVGSRGGELSRRRLRAIDAELGRAALALEDLAEVGRGSPPLRHVERVDLTALAADSVEAWRAAAEAAGVALREAGNADDVAVWGDRRRLSQALGNLIANAIEHGGAAVEVRVARRGPLGRVEVSDDGPGLPAPVAVLRRRGQHGRGAHGHGLAIASAIVEAHRGRLAAAPAHCGTRMVVELPVAWPTALPGEQLMGGHQARPVERGRRVRSRRRRAAGRTRRDSR